MTRKRSILGPIEEELLPKQAVVNLVSSLKLVIISDSAIKRMIITTSVCVRAFPRCRLSNYASYVCSNQLELGQLQYELKIRAI